MQSVFTYDLDGDKWFFTCLLSEINKSNQQYVHASNTYHSLLKENEFPCRP